jgi:hypothetical protein
MTITRKDLKVNKKRLTIELSIVGFILAIVFVPKLWGVIFPPPSDPYWRFQTLLNKVQNFDFENGDRTKLWEEIERKTASIDSRVVTYHFNMMAKALYLYNISDHYASISTLDIALDFAPASKRTNVYELYILNYQALGDLESAKRFQTLLDNNFGDITTMNPDSPSHEHNSQQCSQCR